MSSGESNKSSGQFHSAKGGAVEAIGNVTGSESWSASGKKEHAKGEAETKSAEAKGVVEGLADRAKGMKDSVVGAVTGDQIKETEGDMQQKKGKAQQEMNS